MTVHLARILRAQVLRIAGVVHSILAEIFDEAAYARFLERQGVENSRKAYAQFLCETGAARSQRPRCC